MTTTPDPTFEPEFASADAGERSGRGTPEVGALIERVIHQEYEAFVKHAKGPISPEVMTGFWLDQMHDLLMSRDPSDEDSLHVRDMLAMAIIGMTTDPATWKRALVLLSNEVGDGSLAAAALSDRVLTEDFQWFLLTFEVLGIEALAKNEHPLASEVLDEIVDRDPLTTAMWRDDLEPHHVRRMLETARDWAPFSEPLLKEMLGSGLRMMTEDQCREAWNLLLDAEGFDLSCVEDLVDTTDDYRTMLPLDVLDAMLLLLDERDEDEKFTGAWIGLNLLIRDAHCDRLGIARENSEARIYLTVGWPGGLDDMRDLRPESGTVRRVLTEHPNP